MATYKVIQDIEADDKFVGPLTLKQFIFAMVGMLFAYLSFFAITSGFPYALVILAPPMFVGFFMAVPWSKHQPTDVWVLAKLRFMLVPRKRIWDQSGMEELVTITAPKKEEKHLSDNLSQNEVKSRLSALAQTIDSRGWAVKDISRNASIQAVNASDDRLVDSSILPTQAPIMDTSTLPDLYEDRNATATNFDRMLQQSNQLHHVQTLETMNNVRSGSPTATNQTSHVNISTPAAQANDFYASSAIDEESLNEELKSRKAPDEIATSHMRRVNPTHSKKAKPSPKKHKSENKKQAEKPRETTVPPTNQAVILEYANNNDLNVATIARQAKKDSEEDEVVISLR